MSCYMISFITRFHFNILYYTGLLCPRVVPKIFWGDRGTMSLKFLWGDRGPVVTEIPLGDPGPVVTKIS